MKELKEQLASNLQDYLEEQNINTRKNFICLNPDHAENVPSMSYDAKRNKVHCFGCGADYDIFNLIGIEYGLDSFQSQFNKACELYGVNPNKVMTKPRNTVKTPQFESVEKYLDYCCLQVNQTDYFARRGLTQDTIKTFNLGYDPATKNAIIPVSSKFYVARSVGGDKRFCNPPGAEVELFNTQRMRQKERPIFIVESTICALSIEQNGAYAVALNGLNNVKKLIELIKTHQLTDRRFIVCLDNDDAGAKESDKLVNELKNLKVDAIKVNIASNCKDPNELLIKDAIGLAENIIKAERGFAEIEEAEKQQVLQQYKQKSALGHLQGFIDGIATVNTSFIPTGFRELDKTLDGGLFEGLYFIGALSSLGKTTFTLQVADQIAQQGHDVLIISLEMARTELMAKSISRLTALNDYRNAKTTRGITTATFYKGYSLNERECINNAFSEYATYAEHIYIEESVGDTTVAKVRELIEEHIKITGNKPLVIIDYVQILRPINTHMSDKQAVDYNVMELKRISRDFKIPIIGISSLNRQSYSQAISMTSFKESGAIEYSSDVLIGLQLKGAGEKDFDEKKIEEGKSAKTREIELVILKNRNGKTGVKVDYHFTAMFNLFEEMGVVVND